MHSNRFRMDIYELHVCQTFSNILLIHIQCYPELNVFMVQLLLLITGLTSPLPLLKMSHYRYQQNISNAVDNTYALHIDICFIHISTIKPDDFGLLFCCAIIRNDLKKCISNWIQLRAWLRLYAQLSNTIIIIFIVYFTYLVAISFLNLKINPLNAILISSCGNPNLPNNNKKDASSVFSYIAV